MIRIAIVCDVCRCDGAEVTREWAAHKMRAELAVRGWLYVESGGKDYCPICRPKKRQPMKYETTL